MKRIGLFPGTFDPITIGHQDIINRSLPLFDKLVIGIGRNATRNCSSGYFRSILRQPSVALHDPFQNFALGHAFARHSIAIGPLL